MGELTIECYTEDDKESVSELITNCFGDRCLYLLDNEDFTSTAKLLKNDKRELIAMSSIQAPYIRFRGYEIGWTGCNPKFRVKGYMSLLLGELLEELEDDGIPVYCACWKVLSNRINLYHSMNEHGFKCVTSHIAHCTNTDSMYCDKCTFRRECGNCWCEEDLYKLTR